MPRIPAALARLMPGFVRQPDTTKASATAALLSIESWPARVESARSRRFRARGLHAERDRLPLRTDDRGSRCIDPAAAL